jgi:hypothetical protein
MGNRSQRISFSAIAILLAHLLLGARADAATAYRFVAKTDGVYATERSGVVLEDTDRWRVTFDVRPDEVPVFTRVIASPSVDGPLVAVNDTNRTWYRLRLEDPLGSTSSLFHFGVNPLVKGIEVRTEGERIIYSYRLVTSEATAKVFGVIRMDFRPTGSAPLMPWSPLQITTGVREVDSALRNEFTKFGGRTPWKTETEVSRRVADGVVMRQLITRTMEPAIPAKATPADFAIPAGYVNQEPVLGIPGP